MSRYKFQTFSAAHTYSARKHSLIVNIALDPTHQVFDVCRSGHFRGTFEVLRILPEVFELVGRFHLRACLWRTEFGDRSIEQVDMIVEVHH
jgi:hypothetical protein